MTGMVVLIPAYEPDGRLIELVVDLAVAQEQPRPQVVVVDDGSGSDYEAIFDAVRLLGAHVIVHSRNRGKGIALKTGFAYIAITHPSFHVVCADSDGQHCASDIGAVALAAASSASGRIVLGSRTLDASIPWKSKVGNDLTRALFRAVTGVPLRDTQTGLRAYSSDLLGWLTTIPGSRFEYELNVLLQATQARIPLLEEPIQTIYLDGNESSHFDPLRDSIRVYSPLVGFAVKLAWSRARRVARRPVTAD